MICKKCKTEIYGALQDCPFCELPIVEYKIKKVIGRRPIPIDPAIMKTHQLASNMLKIISSNETDYKINCYKDAYFIVIE